MSDILFIKTSSLGDVIHHMPALSEARHRRPDARFTWVVEEAFAPIVLMHPAVAEVIPIAMRRWRASKFAPVTWLEMVRFVRRLRHRAYDEIVDTQGLFFKSGLIGRVARGRRHGYDESSIRDPAATSLYDVHHPVARDLHAIARNRLLTGLALGYTPEGPIDFGLSRGALAQARAKPYGVLLHATARPEKEWEEGSWMALARWLTSSGCSLLLPWWTAAERARSERIAAGLATAEVPDRQPLDRVAALLAGAAFVVGVDTGLSHLAAALGTPLVAIFVGSQPALTGPIGSGPIAVVGGRLAQPSVNEVMAALEGLRRLPSPATLQRS
jgi:heptosyltransferase-1